MPVIGILLGLSLLTVAALGIKHGTVLGKNGRFISKDKHPRLFRAGIAFYVIGALLAIYAGFSQ